MIQRSCDGKQRILNLSYGKDSMACLGTIEKLDWPLDRIVTADVWATDTIPADLPPMVEFKKYADNVIKERYGIQVEHYRAKLTFESGFYQKFKSGKYKGKIYGFPFKGCNWCNSALKRSALNLAKKQSIGAISYIGIASDEPKRFGVLSGDKISPLVQMGMTEEECKKWCKDNELLSPIYDKTTRGGCWFCYNQSIQQLRTLRKEYPDLWAMLIKWDADSTSTFRSDGHTVHDFNRRFSKEDEGAVPMDRKFRWKMIE